MWQSSKNQTLSIKVLNDWITSLNHSETKLDCGYDPNNTDRDVLHYVYVSVFALCTRWSLMLARPSCFTSVNPLHHQISPSCAEDCDEFVFPALQIKVHIAAPGESCSIVYMCSVFLWLVIMIKDFRRSWWHVEPEFAAPSLRLDSFVCTAVDPEL